MKTNGSMNRELMRKRAGKGFHNRLNIHFPSNTNGGGLAPMSFPYFQLYTLDDYSGVVLYPGQYQQATRGNSVSFIAQVSGSTGPYT